MIEMKKIDQSRPVRFKKPGKGEEDLVFQIDNYNEVTGRCYISPLKLKGWEGALMPSELVSLDDLENI